MKISILLLLTITTLPHSDCGLTTYFAKIPVVGTIVKGTSKVTTYISDKGRHLKNRIASYFHPEDKNVEAARVMSTPNLLAYHGYPAETHTIVTDDGYVLSTHRIPYSKKSYSKVSPKKSVLLHHGVLGSSVDWIIAGPEKGLAYILSDQGYDVWMANARGNTYSRDHIFEDVNSFAFWNFTFHEMGQHDLSAVIDYITDVKGDGVKLNYVGFSMGTTVLFSLLSIKTEYNDVLNAGFAIAPIAYMGSVKSPIRLLARYSNKLEYWMEFFGANEFLPQNKMLTRLSKSIYKLETDEHKGVISKNIFFILCGYDEKQFNKSLVPAILNHVPAGTSTKNLIHYAQEISNKGEFQQFDYGLEGNLKQYGVEKPPKYQLERITLPIALISASNDLLSSSKDVERLHALLPNPIEHYVVPFKEFNHVDFLWAVDAPALVYRKLLQLLADANRDDWR